MVSQSVMEEISSPVSELFLKDDKVTAVPVVNQQLNVVNPNSYFNAFSYFKCELQLLCMTRLEPLR